jgi:hypothetical protein
MVGIGSGSGVRRAFLARRHPVRIVRGLTTMADPSIVAFHFNLRCRDVNPSDGVSSVEPVNPNLCNEVLIGG